MANLGPLQQNLTYGNLLQVDGGLGATLKPVLDGDGNESGLSLSLTGVGISGLVADSASNLYSGFSGAVPYQVAANTTGFVAAGIAGQLLASNGASAPAWTTVTAATLGAVASDGSVPMTGNLSMGGHAITNLLNPLASTDAATKAYVDSLATGLQVKSACRLATTANLSLTGAATVDGVATSAGDRILVKSQTNAAENGIYVASASAWTRAADADTWSELIAAATFITAGSTQANTTWVSNTTAGGTLGTTAINFVLFGASAAYTAGTGLSLVGSQFSLSTPVSVANGGSGATTLTGYVKGNGGSAMTAVASIPNTDVSGLGTLSTQNANAVTITGGTINGTTLGATTPSAATVTALTASGAVNFSEYITVDPLVAAYFKNPRIWDSSQTHWYRVTTSELTDNRYITLPILGADDTFAFNNNTATLTNKTISGATNTLSNIGNTSLTNSSITINGTPVNLGGSITVSGATSIFVSNITALRAVNRATYQFAYVEGYYAAGDGGGGNYYYDAADTTSADNGGTIIVATDGGRWKLANDGLVSVKQFGAKGDGTTNDATAIQSCINACNNIYFPSGTYLITSTLLLRAVQMDIQGEGRLSIITGSVSPLVQYPTSVTDTGGNFVTQNLYDLSIVTTANNVGLQIAQTWTAAGKPSIKIHDCFFRNASTTTTTAKCINLQGVWGLDISFCQFEGKGAGGGPTTGIGGYGIYAQLASAMSSSVMNASITDCNFLTIAYPIYIPPRAGDGRCEGWHIAANTFIAGYKAITTYQTLATTVASNFFSDYNITIESNYDFESTISANLIDGPTFCGVYLKSGSAGIVEGVTIAANTISSPASTCIIILNSTADNVVRNISITANSFLNATSPSPAGTAIAFTGSFACAGIAISGNSFKQLQYGINYSGSATNSNVTVDSNAYVYVTTPINNITRSGTLIQKSYSTTAVITTVSGATTLTANFTVPANTFNVKPDFAIANSSGNITSELINAYYDWDNVSTSATNLVFVLQRNDAGAFSGGGRRFYFICSGTGFATQ